ncbi:MAG: folylpolyglutamate synthase/dihydrofolate synthase family protein [Pyrinomonadaceae bacterium]
MNFSAALDYLYGLGHETLAMKFGLQNTQILLAAFDNPQQSFLKIQIAGTNGKGSVCAFLNAICQAANLKPGLYTSPHLIRINERIRINDLEISENDFAKLAHKVRETAESLIAAGKLEAQPTFFEHLTVIALLAFREANIDIAILETGLGGRLDSTTAAGAEIVGITPISPDHQEYLGNTLTEIAAEKAAIINSSVRFAASATQDPSVLRIVRGKSRQFGLTLATSAQIIKAQPIENLTNFEVNLKTRSENYSGVLLGLSGKHQLENAALAVTIAEELNNFNFKVSRSAIIHGLESVRHPGRLESWHEYAPPILFDGAHNAAGAKALREFLHEFYSQTPLTIIFGAMRDKDLAQITLEIFPLATNLILTRVDNPRSAALEDLQIFSSNKIDTHLAKNVTDALQTARVVTPESGLICITGSLYLVGEAQKILLAENRKVN